MRTWIALHLPLLPLETLRPCWNEPLAQALLEQDRVIVLNALAQASGVWRGMRRGSVAAIAPDTVISERQIETEQEAINSIALAMLQFTPEVVLADEWSVLLDVTASLRAFNGRLALTRRVRAVVADLGFTMQLGMAPTAHGAWLLACAAPSQLMRRHRRFIRLQKMSLQLDRLPYTLLLETQPYSDWLNGIGCRTLGDLRKLPRAGLQRRCSKSVLDALDRAYGDAPELFEWIQAPATFSARHELLDRIEHAEALLFAAKRLILQMVGWLVAHQLAAAHFVFMLEHERGRSAIEPTLIDIVLAEPAWRDEHLIRLLKERLGTIQLHAPVIAIRLDVPQTSPMAPVTDTLFPEPGGTAADHRRLLELLTARLGNDRVLMPDPHDDYRPEVGNRWKSAAAARRAIASVDGNPERPFWLLEKPLALLMRDNRPFYGSPLRLIRGPERIECGWWDGGLVERDYFVAQGEEAACYWVYRERAGHDARWFLHGLYA